MKTENEIYRYLYKREKPMVVKTFAYILAALALFQIRDTPIFSIIMCVGSIGLFAYHSGIEIDFRNKKHRLISSFGPQSIGEWKPLPVLEYISVFKVNVVSTAYGRSGASISRKQALIQVNLIKNQNKRLRIYETNDLEEAMQFAKDYSLKLNLKIWDATTHEAKMVVRDFITSVL